MNLWQEKGEKSTCSVIRFYVCYYVKKKKKKYYVMHQALLRGGRTQNQKTKGFKIFS